MADVATVTRPIPAPFVFLLALAVAVIWLAILVMAVVALRSGGHELSLAGLLPPPMDGPMRTAVGLQLATSGLQLLIIVGFGTAALFLLAIRSMVRAARTLQIMIWCLMGLAVLGMLTSAAMPFAMSGSIVSALPILITALPVTAVQIAVLVLAERYLSLPPPNVF
jgi:hypothetical protein